MARRKDIDWNLPDGNASYDAVQTAVLMDLRDELKDIKQLLGCFRIQRMFSTIERLDKRLAHRHPLKRKRKK